MNQQQINRLEKIREIAIDYEVPFVEVMEIYSKFNSRVYTRMVKDAESCNGTRFEIYHPSLEKKTRELTERYFRRVNRELKGGENGSRN